MTPPSPPPKPQLPPPHWPRPMWRMGGKCFPMGPTQACSFWPCSMAFKGGPVPHMLLSYVILTKFGHTLKATRFVYLYLAFVVCPKCKVKGRYESCLVTFCCCCCCCWCLLPCIVHFAKFKFMCEHVFLFVLASYHSRGPVHAYLTPYYLDPIQAYS
jgi:hypothetical protein